MSIKFRLLQIAVSDPDKARDFYLNTLGFLEDKNSSSEKVPALLTDYGFPILLYPGIPVPREYPNDCSPVMVIEVEDILVTYQLWKGKGVEFLPISWSKDETGIAECPFGKFIAFRDPDGNVHELIQRYK